MSLALLLLIIGAALIFFEVIVPGGILGLLGGLAMLAGCVVAFMRYGWEGGLLVTLLAVAVLGITLFLQFRVLPKTQAGRKMFLESAISGSTGFSSERAALVGRTCEALTTLAPSGLVLLDGQKHEAFSQDGLVEKGTRLKVVDFDNFRLKVRKL